MVSSKYTAMAEGFEELCAQEEKSNQESSQKLKAFRAAEEEMKKSAGTSKFHLTPS